MYKSQINNVKLMWALVQVLPIKHNKFLSDCYEPKVVQRHSIQRSGLGVVLEFEKRPPGTAAKFITKS